jgi:hypothetical protein
MALAEFKPLRELGLIAGLGILLILGATFLLLPALLVRFSPAVSATSGRERGTWPLPVLPLRGRGPAVAVIAVGAALTVLLALPIRPIEFSTDQRAMLPADAPSVQWLERLEDSGTFSSAFNASIATSLADVEERSRAFTALPTVSHVQSILSFLPKDADAKRPLVQQIRAAWRRLPDVRFETPPVDVAALEEALATLRGFVEVDLPFTLSNHGKPELAPATKALAEALRALERRLAALPPREAQARLERFQQRASAVYTDLRGSLDSDRDSVKPEDVPAEARSLFYAETPQGPRYLIRVYPTGHVEDPAFAPRFLADTRTVDPDITGFPVNFFEFAVVMEDDFKRASIYALAAIVLLLLIDLRRKRDLLLALVPLGMGATWMVGSMNLLGMDYNLANIMAIPLLVGIGVAYGVYVIHRVREESPPRPRRVIATTGKAVLFSALTTMVSFGAMSMASHRGASSLGNTLLLGIAYCVVGALVVLPALLRVVPDPDRAETRG